MSEKKTMIYKISSKNIKKLNDILLKSGNCDDIKKYKECFLKCFDTEFNEYYKDFSDRNSTDSDSSSVFIVLTESASSPEPHLYELFEYTSIFLNTFVI